jgi:hypothetical protein
VDSPIQSRERFAQDHFAGAELGDRRRSKRLVTLAQQFLTRPCGTLPNKLPDPYQLDAAYRFFRTTDVTPDAIQRPHRRRTRQQLEGTDEVVLIAHDGTELNFTGLDVPDLGVLAGPGSRGLVAHNSLALTASGCILGLLHQILFAPRKAPPRSTAKSKRRRDPNKASTLWRDALAAIGPTPVGKRWIHLADRGADVTEFLDYADEHRMEYVVRINHNRRVTVNPTTGAKLHETLRNQAELGRRTQDVSAQAGRPARSTTVAISALSLALVAPRQARGRERGVPLPVVAIRVWEVDPPVGAEPLEWLLVTNVAGVDATSAWERVDWYAKRWTVEEYHKGLKTGLGLEELQLTTPTGLRNAIALLSVVSVGLVMLRELARDPTVSEQPIAAWVPAAWVSVLARWRQGTGGQLTSVKQWIWALARLGGHQNAQHLGSPGWLTLLRGWTRLQAMIDGWELHNNCGGS